MSWFSWAIVDSLYCREQYQFSHLDSLGHYIQAYSDSHLVTRICLNQPEPRTGHVAWPAAWHTIESDRMYRDGMGLPDEPYDVAMWLDGFGRLAEVPARKRIAQVAARCSPMPWEVRNPDGSPAYALMLSSIPALVDEARAHGQRAEFMPLAFDLRCRAAVMGVKRQRKAIFIGTRGPNHRRREEWLTELADLVEAMPPVFGREYVRALAGARVVLNVHAEWAQGAANSMRLFESAGLGCAIVSDGLRPYVLEWPRPFHFQVNELPEARGTIEYLLSDAAGVEREIEASTEEVLRAHTYESRIPRLVEMVRGL